MPAIAGFKSQERKPDIAADGGQVAQQVAGSSRFTRTAVRVTTRNVNAPASETVNGTQTIATVAVPMIPIADNANGPA